MFFLIFLFEAGESPPQLHIKPCLQVQKIENIQACLEFLVEGGRVSIHSISAEGASLLQ